MFEIYTETTYEIASEHRREELKNSQIARMIRHSKLQTPRAWDYVTLRLGNWLIKLGIGLKSRSVFSNPTNNRV